MADSQKRTLPEDPVVESDRQTKALELIAHFLESIARPPCNTRHPRAIARVCRGNIPLDSRLGFFAEERLGRKPNLTNSPSEMVSHRSIISRDSLRHIPLIMNSVKRGRFYKMLHKPGKKPKLTDAERHKRFVDTARKVDASEKQEDFDMAVDGLINRREIAKKK